MRVSKTIREYVESRVKEIYKPSIESVDKEYFAKKEYLENIVENIANKANQEIRDMLEKQGFVARYSSNDYTYINTNRIINYDMEEKIREEKRALTKECNEKIQEILVTLELGGTKKDLEEMLADISK